MPQKEITKDQKIEALKASIAKYEAYDARTVMPYALGSDNCPCCNLVTVEEEVKCKLGCPIYEHNSDHYACYDTPYYDLRRVVMNRDLPSIEKHLAEEITFLKSVLTALEASS